jgi:glutamate/aspartate transport system permease protein
MHWDWQVFCNSTLSGEATACFGAAGDITYLQWMISAWGWTASVAALGFVIALFFGVMVMNACPSSAIVWVSGQDQRILLSKDWVPAPTSIAQTIVMI